MKKTTGFTLIEIMVVVVIIGLLATLAIAIVTPHGPRARETITIALLQEVATAIEFFQEAHGRCPDTLDDLHQKPATIEPAKWKAFLRRKPLDAWGNELLYRMDAATQEYDLRSLGADGREGGEGPARDISYKDQTVKQP